MADEKKRALLYERVSVQVTGTEARAVEEQNTANLAACERYGWAVTGRYADPGRSASRFKKKRREEYDRLIAAVKAGRGDLLIFWESSRGSRELEEWAHLLNECRARGVRIYVTSHDRLYNLARSRDWRTLAEDGVDAGYESEKTSDRVKRALDANAAKGRPHSNIPVGYERVYDERTRELVAQRPDPETSWIPREIITRVAAAETISSIARDFRRRGVPTPKGGTWVAARIRQVAGNPAYIGRQRYNGELIDAIWPGIADAATFWAAQRVLSDPVRRNTCNGAAVHLLSYLASCGKCGQLLSSSRDRPGEQRGYRCHLTGCTSIRQDWLDAFITGAITERLSDPESYRLITGGDGDAAVLGARTAIEELRARKRAAADAYRRRELSLEMLSLIDGDLSRAIAGQERVASQSSMPPVLRHLDPAADIREQFESAALPARKDIVRLLFGRIAVFPALRRGPVRAFDPRRVEFEWRQPG